MASLFEELGTASLAPTPDAPLGFKKCHRCNGTGFYSHNVRRVHMGAPGGCLKCDGEGRFRVSTAEEIAAEKAIQMMTVRRAGALDKIMLAVSDRDDIRVLAMNGRERLERTAPERFAKMVEAVHAGRLEDVISALVAYEKAEHRIEVDLWRATRETG